MPDTIIYVEDENQKKELMRKFPKVKAEWITVEGEIDKELLPVICSRDEEGNDSCESGEQYIEGM